MFAEYHAHEMLTATKRSMRNALKFVTSGEVYSKEGWEDAEGLLGPPPNCSDVGTPQVELDGAIGEALIPQNPLQCVRTKLIFNIFFDDPFFGLMGLMNRLRCSLTLWI